MSEIGVTEHIINRFDSVQAFYSRYERKYGPIPEEVCPLLAYSYDAMKVLLHAIETTAFFYADGSVGVNRLVLAKAIRSMHNFTGLTGTISFDRDGDRVPYDVPVR
jgi:ABC-type branched-subunit amino acid transport system substrate-binding protein